MKSNSPRTLSREHRKTLASPSNSWTIRWQRMTSHFQVDFLTVCRSFNSEDDYSTGCQNVSHRQKQSFSGPHSLDDHLPPTYEMTPAFKPFTVRVLSSYPRELQLRLSVTVCCAKYAIVKSLSSSSFATTVLNGVAYIVHQRNTSWFKTMKIGRLSYRFSSSPFSVEIYFWSPDLQYGASAYSLFCCSGHFWLVLRYQNATV